MSASPIVYVMSPHIAELNSLTRAFSTELTERIIKPIYNKIEMLEVFATSHSSIFSHLVILDFDIKEVNVIDVLREREKSDNWLHIPFIVLTSHYDQRILDVCRQSGADNVIPKPALLGEYLHLIRDLSNSIISTTDSTIPEIPKDSEQQPSPARKPKRIDPTGSIDDASPIQDE